MEPRPSPQLVDLIARLRAGVGFREVVREVLEEQGLEGDDGGEETLFDLPVALDLDAAAADLARWQAAGYTTTPFWDQRYPSQLLEIHETPPVLWTRGELRGQDLGVCVVGTRNPTEEGRRYAADVSIGLGRRGITVVSGLASGVDRIAHESALGVGARTVAVLGTGLDHAYPKENAELQERIAREGLLLSQFWPHAHPTKKSFPMRNAVMSGYGRASIIVEAGEFSGTRTQGRLAIAHGRAVVLSKLVTERTQWGAELVGRPGVFVAENAMHAVELSSAFATPVADTVRGLLPAVASA